jgi:hypothetical protein
MEKIKIYHAFNGFLYAPVFLAARLGFFPQNTELVYTGADSKTIDELCKYSEEEKHWFAICDPFSVDIRSSYPAGTNDRICIVGSLINVLPFWIFNPDQNIHGTNREADLQKYHNSFTKVVVYPKGTTGYLVGKRVQTILGLNDQLIEQRNFGEEFNGGISNKEVVVTADVLRLVHEGLDTHNILLDYPTRSPNTLFPYLFTAILTLKNTVDSSLWTVLGVLGAIQAAINCLSADSVRPEHINTLVDIFDTPEYGDTFRKVGLQRQDEKAELIRKSIRFLFKQQIYSQYPKPANSEDWVRAWNNANALWMEYGGRSEYSTEVEEQEEPIPSLLVKARWKERLRAYYETLLSPSTPHTPDIETQRLDHIKRKDKILVVSGWVFVMLLISLMIFAGFITFDPDKAASKPHGFHQSLLLSALLLVFFLGYLLSFRQLRKAVYELQETGEYLTLAGICLGIFLTLIGALVYLI